MGLTTGLGTTTFGYFIQGWFKFSRVKFFKIKAAGSLGEEKSWANKTSIYLTLVVLDTVRIRAVSDPKCCDGLADGFRKILKAEGAGGLYV